MPLTNDAIYMPSTFLDNVSLSCKAATQVVELRNKALNNIQANAAHPQPVHPPVLQLVSHAQTLQSFRQFTMLAPQGGGQNLLLTVWVLLKRQKPPTAPWQPGAGFGDSSRAWVVRRGMCNCVCLTKLLPSQTISSVQDILDRLCIVVAARMRAGGPGTITQADSSNLVLRCTCAKSRALSSVTVQRGACIRGRGYRLGITLRSRTGQYRTSGDLIHTGNC